MTSVARVAPLPGEPELSDPGAFYKSQPGALNNPHNTIPEHDVWHSNPTVCEELPFGGTDKTQDGVVLEIDLQDLQPITPPDGGWGWFVVLGSFLCMFLVDGVCFSYGIFLSELEITFGASKTQMTLAGALLTGCYFMVGPIASGLMNRFGARILVMFGASLSSIGIISSTFATDLSIFIGTFGVIGGIGFGLIYVPAATIVTTWFVNKRATVTGIITAGSGIGVTCYSLVIPHLIQMFTWRGCILLLAAVNLNAAVAGALFRPLQHTGPAAMDKKKGRMDRSKLPTLNENGAIETEPNVRKPPSASRFPKQTQFLSAQEKSNIQKLARQYVESMDTVAQNLTQVAEENLVLSNPGLSDGIARRITRREGQIRRSNTSWDDIIITYGNQLVPLPEDVALAASKEELPKLSMDTVNRIVEEVLGRQAFASTTSLAATEKPVKSKAPAAYTGSQRWLSSTHSQLGQVSVQPSDNAVVYLKPDNMGSTSYFASAISLRAIPDINAGAIDEQAIHDAIMKELRKEVARPVHRKDLFLSGSLIHINEYLATPDVESFIRQVTVPAEEIQAKSPIMAMLRSMFGVSILRSPTFQLLNISSIITMVGYIVPYQFLKDNAQFHGYGETESAYLLASLGILNTIGRLISGWLSDRPWVNIVLVNNVSLLVSGVATAILPLLRTYTGMMFYACFFGFAIAAFIAVRTILIVELIGLDRLSNAFGFLLLFQGIAVVGAPPALGFMYDTFGNFNVTFIFGGIALFVSGLLCIPLSSVARWERGKELATAEWEDENVEGCFRAPTKCIRLMRDCCLTRCCPKKLDYETKVEGVSDFQLYDVA
ncbi:Monocarboxylate transporter 12-B [Clonorchis sinensis]|uniref:Monocarboxylate transporter 12-B n=1 Tax=Clonorchis sinensis TaxID=79923 RepID=A0A3R7JGZ1_CLOSI|nr:Monocarboxylate transporter 12-B [Clonorchis sinensis]